MPRVKSFNNRKKTKLSCSLEKQKIEQVVCIVFTTGIISDVGSSCINKLIKNFMKNVSCRKSIALNHSYLQSQDDPKSSYSRTDVEVVEMDSVPKIKELSINIINSHELFIEKVNPVPTLISGHRIVDLQYVLSWALHLQDEHSKICTFSRLEVVDEVRAGLTSLIVFQCVVCGHRIEKSTENPDNDKSEINYGAVCGTLSTGSTYQHLKNFLGIMDIPCMSYRCFHSIEIQLGDQWKSNLWMSMEKAGKEEKGLAIESGQVDSDRLPWTIVYCDGGCSHRSYEKLLTSEGRELRRALFSLKQIFQEDKDLVHEFVQNDGLSCLIKVGSEADQNYQNYILRALGQVMLYVDGMNGVMEHNLTVQWLYSLISSKFRLVVKTALKLLLVFVEYTDSNCMLLIKAIHIVDYSQGALPYHNIMKLLKDFDSADTELLIYATTLINKILSGVPDQDTYYDQTDALEEQGLEAIIQRYMSKPGTDLDLLQQFQIYETVLQYEDGEDISGTPTRHLDETLRKTLRNRKSVVDNSERRKSRRHSTGNTPVYPGLHRNNNLILQTNQEDDDDQSSSSQSSAINNSQLNGSYKDGNRANEAGITPALKRRRERAERQRSFMKEQESAGFFRECHLREENVENEKGNYTNSLQHRIANGNGYSRNSSRKDLTPLMNVVNKLDTEEKQPWIYSMIPNPDNLDETENTNDNERNVLLQLKKENTVKDLTQKLANQNIQHSPSEENKVNRIGDMSGLISKAKEGLAKSKSKADVLKSPTSETLPKVEMKKSENELRWEELVANFNRSLNLCDMDFTDLASEDEVDILAPVAVANGVPPPPPPLHDLGSSAPPPPPLSNRIAHSIIPPSAPSLPLFGVHLQRTNRCAETKIPIKKNKKTVKLFWKEVRDDPIIHVKLKTGFIWDELCPVNVDTQKLEHLFESRAKDLISKKQQEMNKNKEIIVLDPKRSNAINIGMTKLPPPRSIKTAILKMDATIMNREGIEKLLTMLPTEDERTKIQDAQAANPDLPLGSAEQFLLTLASISELPARLKLWAFKLDFENSEREIAEPLMDLKQGVEVLRVNKTFRGILSTLLSVGNFLNGNEVKGFQIEYLAKVPEVKDTVHKHSLLHHLCHIVMEKFPDATDLYSEIGAITRASKIDFDELALNIHRLETDCKASWDHLKLIAKHDGSTMMKVKMSDFLSDCAERIILLAIIHRRIINRFHKFLLWMGIPLHQISDTKPNEFCRIVSEFALEYRTTRERVLQQLEKKANHRERNKTRGKMITDVGKFRTKEDRADAELRQLLGSDISDVESMQGTLPWRRTRRDGNKSFLSPGNGNLTDGDDEILESLVKTATKGSSNRTAPRERKRTRHADRKSLRRTLKNGLSEEEKKHLSAYIKGY